MEEPSACWEMEEDYFPSAEDYGKVSWLLNKGLGLGKKVLVTGVLMSSAPIVLPPLLVLSAFGFAFSIPSSLFLASYACSEKLLSKLLPGPSPSRFLLDYGGANYTEDDDQYFKKEVHLGEDEEVEHIRNAGERPSMRSELPVEGVRLRLEKVGSDLIASEIVEEDEAENTGNIVDDRAQPQIDAHSRGRRDHILDSPAVDMQGTVLTVEADNRATLKGKATPLGIRHVVVMESAGAGLEDIEERELAKETTGLIELLRDVGREGHIGERHEHAKAISTSVEQQQHKDMKEGIRQDHGKETDKDAKVVETLVEAKDTGKKGKKKGKKKAKSEENILSDVPKHNGKRNESESLASDTAEAKKSVKEQSQTDQSTPKTSEGNAPHSGTASHGSEKSSEIHPGKRVNHPSREGLQGDEKIKIWKHIEAMRVIVGYKATPQATCLDELKALYLFTGIEPPESFKDISDIDELNNKLRFLMSIVGVK